MPTPRKERLVAELTELIQQAEIAIATFVTGVPVGEQIVLRRRLIKEGAQLRVVKNALLRIAATNAGAELYADLADGPTALVVGFDEPIGAARGLAGYIDDTPNTPMEIRAAIVGGVLVDAAYVHDLATVPPRDELLARIAGGLVGQIRELMTLLEATTRDFVGLVDALATQLEEQGGVAEEPVAEEAAAEETVAEEAEVNEAPDEPPSEDSAATAESSDETADDQNDGDQKKAEDAG